MATVAAEARQGRSATISPQRLAKRAMETLHEGGPRALIWQALATAGVRRLQIHCRVVRKPAIAVSGVAVRPVSSGDADAYRALRPDPEITEAEFQRRLQSGDRCVGAWEGGRLVGIRWLAIEEASIPYLGLRLPLAPDACYVYEAFTAPDQRHRGIGNLLSVATGAEACSLGRTKILSGVLPENRAGVAFIRSWSRPLGVVGSVRLGRWRLARSFVSPEYVGQVRTLQRR